MNKTILRNQLTKIKELLKTDKKFTTFINVGQLAQHFEINLSCIRKN